MGKSSYDQVKNHVFELKVMSFLLSSVPQIKLCYEPLGLNRKGKRVDISMQKGKKTYLIELKAFHPDWKSKDGTVAKPQFSGFAEKQDQIWDALVKEKYIDGNGLIQAKFDGKEKTFNLEIDLTSEEKKKSLNILQQAQEIPQQYITRNNEVCMDGHIYHAYQAVRGHLIDMAFEVEDKIINYPSNAITVMGVPLDFHLNIEDFRDFVAHYKLKHHRFDDPLGKMAEYKLGELNKQYRYNINSFWGFPFKQLGFCFRDGEYAVSVAPKIENDVPIKM
jgi:hypothetical protein